MADGVAAEPRGQGYGRKLRIGFVLDVAGYGTRSAPAQNEVQRRLPLLVIDSLAECGLDLGSVDHEWTGDGINVVLPADVDPTVVLPVLIRSLAANLGADTCGASTVSGCGWRLASAWSSRARPVLAAQ